MAEIKTGKPKKRIWLSQLLFTLSLVFLALGLFLLAWAVWPPPRDATQIVIPSGALPGAPSEETFTSLADYRLTLSWPRWLRSGQDANIQVVMEEIPGADNSAEIDRQGQIIIVEPVVMNLILTPSGRVQTNLAPGKSLNLSWDVTGDLAGEHPGKAYVAFGFYDDALAEVVPVPVAVMDINLRVISLWGMGTNLAVWFGFVGMVLWGGLFVFGRLVQGRHA